MKSPRVEPQAAMPIRMKRAVDMLSPGARRYVAAYSTKIHSGGPLVSVHSIGTCVRPVTAPLYQPHTRVCAGALRRGIRPSLRLSPTRTQPSSPRRDRPAQGDAYVRLQTDEAIAIPHTRLSSGRSVDPASTATQ